MKNYYQNLTNSDVYMKDLVDELPHVLKELQRWGCVEVKLKALGTRLVTIV